MSQSFIRIYKLLDINEIKSHLMIYGDLSGSCAHCNKMELKLDTRNCPQCQTEFQYISFRNIRTHMAKISRLLEQRPGVVIVDFEDYSRNMGALKAREFLK